MGTYCVLCFGGLTKVLLNFRKSLGEWEVRSLFVSADGNFKGMESLSQSHTDTEKQSQD